MRNWLWLIGATLLPVGFFLLHFAPDVMTSLLGATAREPWFEALLAGFSIVGAAFFLSWAVELLEHDLPSSLSLIIVALMSVLPEYAIDITFAWKAGYDPTYEPYAIANMTGANRVLIGLGWAVVVVLAWIKTRRPRVELDPGNRLEVGMLLIATIYSFILPIRGSLNLFDAAVFGGMFLLYGYLASKGESKEPELVGPPAMLEEMVGDWGRRIIAISMLLYGGLSIYLAAEPFSESLIQIGESYGLDQFLIVQWLAPLASESPEFLVAIIFVLRNRPSTGLGALLSSKVNQWTLLVGAVPVAYSLSKGEPSAMPLDPRQRDELLLTSAQSLLAAFFLARLRLTVAEALLLLVMFIVQLVLGLPSVAAYIYAQTGLSTESVHAYFSISYGVIFLVMLLQRGGVGVFLRAISLRAQK